MSELLCSRSGASCLIVSDAAVESIDRLASKYQKLETGGILLGYYDATFRVATVVVAADPPADSVHKRTSFERGSQGVDSLILWGKQQDTRLHYIGEWHTHPGKSATPSPVDIRQMKTFAKTRNYGAVTPLLLIAGGHPPNLVWQATLIQPDNQLEKLLPI